MSSNRPSLEGDELPSFQQPQIFRRTGDTKLRELARRAMAEEGISRRLFTNIEGELRRLGIQLEDKELEAIKIIGQRGVFLDEIEEELKQTGIDESDIRALREFRISMLAD